MWSVIGDILATFCGYAAVGSIAYVFDRTLGIGIHRWWYNLRHELPMSAGTEKGVLGIYGHRTRTQSGSAVVLSFLVSVILVVTKYNTLVHEVLFLLPSVAGMLFGFWIGPYVFRLWQKRDAAFETVDSIKDGRIDPVGAAAEQVKSAAAEALSVASGLGQSITEGAQKVVGIGVETPASPPSAPISAPLQAQPVAVEAAPEPQKESPMDVIGRFTGRRP